jgi:hypothetical protein
LRLVFRRSRGGLIAAGLFLLLAAAVFLWIFLVASKNPADSGESGLLLLLFAMPWALWIPVQFLGPGTGVACILLNALLAYCAFGGLRLSRRPQGRGPDQ